MLLPLPLNTPPIPQVSTALLLELENPTHSVDEFGQRKCFLKFLPCPLTPSFSRLRRFTVVRCHQCPFHTEHPKDYGDKTTLTALELSTHVTSVVTAWICARCAQSQVFYTKFLQRWSCDAFDYDQDSDRCYKCDYPVSDGTSGTVWFEFPLKGCASDRPDSGPCDIGERRKTWKMDNEKVSRRAKRGSSTRGCVEVLPEEE